MAFDRCLSLLSLQDKLPVAEIRDEADQYRKEGMAPDAAMQRAVQEHLDMAHQEQGRLLEHVRGKYVEAGGKLPEPGAAKEEPAAGERKDDPYTRDLFGGQDLFDHIETRPGTLEAQKDTARAAVSDLARRLGIDRINRDAKDQGAEVSVLGSRLLKNFIEGKPNQLVGQEARTPADLASLAQVYRDPRFETFRVFYMKDGKIAGEAGYTSRLPAAVHMPNDLLHQIHADKVRFGADGFYLLHNHPSGRSEPSQADINLTRYVDKHLPGFLGHVVIDHNEYSVIHNWGEETIPAPYLNGQDFTGMPEMEHAMLGVKLSSPEAVARAAKALQVPDGHSTLILTNAHGETQLLVDLPMGALARAKTGDDFIRVQVLVRRMTREAGAGGHRFIVLPDGADVKSPVFLKMLAHGIVTDVVDAGGKSLQAKGSYYGGDFIAKSADKTRRSIRVSEPIGEDDRRTIEVDGLRRPIMDASGRLIGGGDFAKQQEFWRNFDGKTDENGRPILSEDDPRAVRDVTADYQPDPEEADKRQSQLARLMKTPKEMLKSAAFNVRMLTVPMAAGSEKAMAMAKDFANHNRRATAQWQAFDKILRDNYSEEQLQKMWTAADQENDLRREGKSSDKAGLASLTAGERKTVELLHAYGQELWTKAQNAGLVEGDGVAFWTPRMAARIYEDGSAEAIRQAPGEFSKEAKNLKTSASSTKHRAYDTTEESEAALKAKLGDDAAYVKNIRVMPLAMAQLERAIAGRTLVNQIKAHGKLAGVDLISDGARPDFVTFDHPALKQWRPKMDWQAVDQATLTARGYDIQANGVYRDGDKLASYRISNGEVQKLQPMLDSDGKPVMESSPLFIRKDFAGPLKAVFGKDLGPVYRGLMSVKGGVTSMIMISPLTHNLVIWGKALPSMISTMGWKNNLMNAGSLGMRGYFVGNAARADHALMGELVEAGLVPVSGRGMNQDIEAIANGIEPGRSLTAKAVGAAFDMVSPKAGDNARRAVDAAGHFWHEKLLWDRVADLQTGMAVMMRTSLMDKGVDQYTANRLAVHFANRYAGMIPHEAMSDGAHALLNLSLFSKSFTMTNLGAYKDVFAGLPKDVRAQIKTRAFELQQAMGKSEDDSNTVAARAVSQAQGIARKKALSILVLDVAAMAGVASITQALWQGQSGQQIKDDLKDRLTRLGIKIKDDPMSIIGHPLDAIASLSQTSDNPHGKEDRVRVGEDESGNSYYARLPVGKVGEEIKQYGNLTTGLHLAHNKMSTFLRPIADLMANEDVTGKRVIDPNSNLLKQAATFAAYWMKSQMPGEEMAAAYHLAKGNADSMDKLKLMGMATGLSVSKLSGGDEVAEIRYQNREQQAQLRDVLPDVREAMRRGDPDKAQQMLEGAGQSPKEANRIMTQIENPGAISRSQVRKFNQHATDDERDRLDRMRAHAGQ